MQFYRVEPLLNGGCGGGGGGGGGGPMPNPKETPASGSGAAVAEPVDVDFLSDYAGSELSSASVVSVVVDCVGIDDVLPSREPTGMVAWGRDRARPVKAFREHLGLHGKGQCAKFKVLKKKVKRSQQKSAAALHSMRSKLVATQVAWNRDKLRRQDRLDIDHAVRRKGRRVQVGCSVQGLHPRAWTAAGTLQVAFRSIGALTPSANTLRTTRRELDAISAVSLASQSHQQDATRTWAVSLESSRPRWIFAGREHDSTPIRVSFGLLHDLAEVARYWHRTHKKGPSCLLTHAEYMPVCPTTLPEYGIIELLAQSCRIAWPELAQGTDFHTVHTKHVPMPAVFMSRSNASTIFASLDRVDPHLAFDKLVALTASVDFVVIFLGSQTTDNRYCVYFASSDLYASYLESQVAHGPCGPVGDFV
jgi:hypothetical protein